MSSIHTFNTTSAAYDATQIGQPVNRGDTLLVLEEGVVGIAYTWPIAVTEAAGELHAPDGDAKVLIEDERWLLGPIKDAVAVADEYQLPVAAWARAIADQSPVKPYTYIVRFDVSPVWVADGFNMTDEMAMDMLSNQLGHACMSNELAAAVIVAPCPARVASEQGYSESSQGYEAAVSALSAGAPRANRGASAVESALMNAIELMGSVAFVRDAGDNSAEILSELNTALAMVRGESPISEIVWQSNPD